MNLSRIFQRKESFVNCCVYQGVFESKDYESKSLCDEKRERKNLCQSVRTDVNGGRASVNWSEEGFKFWSRTGGDVVKPYKVKELNKLKGFGCKSRVTIKYESSNCYYLLIPVIVNKKKRSNEKESVIALVLVLEFFKLFFSVW
jgi:hypothetical protein